MLRCSPEAFAKCPTREICGNIQEATFMEGSECALFNQSVIDRPMTNADRIRAMNDGQLEAFLIDVCLEKDEFPFITDWGKWLQSPVEELLEYDIV